MHALSTIEDCSDVCCGCYIDVERAFVDQKGAIVIGIDQVDRNLVFSYH